ncbi:MarR family transcriptional regulator [Escherichia coli]|uniref:MarR family transcriptional regulator n=1 Tax=Escherichia coli TaxID=562 RepID=UPI0020338F7A|nr:MarR family transcriptional regulator [Escherichia coli]
MSIKNDGHYFCRAGGNRPDGLNEPVTGNSVSPSDISHILDCTRTNVTRITDALEKKGYIQRINSNNDRRAIYIQLTDKGTGLLQSVTDAQKRHLKNMWSVLSETEITQLEHLNRKLLQHFSLF